MRATRAMFGAFGAGVSLAIAASIALLVVSSVVAFRGWPENPTAPSDPEVAQLQANRAEAKRSAATEILALPKAVAVRQAPAKHRSRGTSHVGSAATQSQPASTVTSSAVTADATSSSSDGSGGGNHAVSSKTNATKQVSDTVRDATKAVADTVAPVAPSVAGALESVGAAGADAVDKAGQTADQVVGNVLGQ